ncbi:transcription termination factor MTERF4, chloroplastic [Syzygium oleosum]|uniref:transcription termination factor MTERF4, chloroplastic n=1 Tax=Syzygium oleosum TaxID=219896 RepID=UPI0011D1BA3A|nr:transcription termination factor MTERF4, chloroplastic [Syzygium oleosum]
MQERSVSNMSISISMSMSLKLSSFPPPLWRLQPPPPPVSDAAAAAAIPLSSAPAHFSTRGFHCLLPRSPLGTQNRRPKHPPLLSSPADVPSPEDEEDEEDEDEGEEDDSASSARDAVSRLLHLEFGLSSDDASRVASNAPDYIRSLIDGVRELDELSLWDSSWKSAPLVSASTAAGFREKVAFLAKQRGDRGKVAFLESIGLPLSSALFVARSVSSDSLPTLLRKVKVLKEILFSSSDVEGLLGKNARRMMMHLSIPVDEDVQLTLSFFEKIEARRGGLDMLGYKDASFLYLVESFPRLLSLPIESHVKPLVQFFESIGIPHGRVRNIFLLFPPIIFYKVNDISKKVLVFQKILADSHDVGRMLLKYPWMLSTSIQVNYEEILSFFQMEKVPEPSSHRAIRCLPHIMGCSTSKLKLTVESLGELSVRNKKMGKVIAKSPQLLLRKPEEFFQVVSLLENFGFDRETVGKIVLRCPEIFAASIEKTLNKKLEFLKNMGISNHHLPRVIKKYPEVLVSDVDRTLIPRINYLMEIGLTKREIAFMVRRFSPLLGYSIEEVFIPKLEFLVKTMEKPLKEIVDYPRYFSYSLEKKIKPRYWVLKGTKVECSLKDMLSKNDEEFAAKFIYVDRMLLPPAPSHH